MGTSPFAGPTLMYRGKAEGAGRILQETWPR
jgi:hypothetical protein